MKNPLPCDAFLRAVPFKAVILYDDCRSLARASLLMDRLTSQFGSEPAIESSFWYAGLLGHSQWWKQATAEAAESSLIVISFNRATGLSAGINLWMEDWSPLKRGGGSALVMLLDRQPEPEMEPLAACLQEKAAEAGMDFFFSRYGDQQPPGFAPPVPSSDRSSFAPRNLIPLEFAWARWSMNN